MSKVFLQRFEVIENLTVEGRERYKCMDLVTNKPCILKMVQEKNREATSQFIARLKRFKGIDGIPQALYYDSNIVVIEWIEGIHLEEWIRTHEVTKAFVLMVVDEILRLWWETEMRGDFGHGDFILYNIIVRDGGTKLGWVDMNKTGSSHADAIRMMREIIRRLRETS